MNTATPPTAELHIHIEGSLEPEMVFDLATKNGVELPFADVEELRQAYRFDDLQSFLDLYYRCMGVLLTRDDFRELALAYLRRGHEQGVRHAELFFDPQAHTTRGVDIDDVIDGLLDGLAVARAELGVTGGLILCFLRDRPVDEAMAALESVAHRASDLVGVGLDSAELGYPPALFTDVYARASELGLRLVAHAGEEGPAEYIVEALDLLKVERIDHGVRCLDDEALVARLVSERIPLTVCPFSNVRLRVVDRLEDHPLPLMLDRGLIVTVNSDDPAYFGGYVGENYEGLARSLNVSRGALAVLARNSVHASFADDERKAQLLAEIEDWERAGE